MSTNESAIGNKMPITAEDLVSLMNLAIRNGSIDAFKDVLRQWLFGAVNEINRQKREIEILQKALDETKKDRNFQQEEVRRLKEKLNRYCNVVISIRNEIEELE